MRKNLEKFINLRRKIIYLLKKNKKEIVSFFLWKILSIKIINKKLMLTCLLANINSKYELLNTSLYIHISMKKTISMT